MNFVIKPYENWNSVMAQDIEASDIFKACEEYAKINKITGILLVVLPNLECKAVTVYLESGFNDKHFVYPRYIAIRKIKTVSKEKFDDLFPVKP